MLRTKTSSLDTERSLWRRTQITTRNTLEVRKKNNDGQLLTAHKTNELHDEADYVR